jgi:hypothetical protein
MKIHFLKFKLPIMRMIGMICFMAAIAVSTNANAQTASAVDAVSQPGDADESSVTASTYTKHFTRAEILMMTVDEQRSALKNSSTVEITDLVNATAEIMEPRQENLIYISVSEFYSADFENQINAIKVPALYIIYQ